MNRKQKDSRYRGCDADKDLGCHGPSGVINVPSQKQSVAILLTNVIFLEAGKPVML